MSDHQLRTRGTLYLEDRCVGKWITQLDQRARACEVILDGRYHTQIGNFVLVISYQRGMRMIVMVAVAGVCRLQRASRGGLIIANQRSRDVSRPGGHDREKQRTHNND